MNREHWKKLLPIITAYAEGKEIEFLDPNYGGRAIFDTYWFSSDVNNYRIKEHKLPEPPPGKHWHREDLKGEWFPSGYRPLLDGEQIESGDEYYFLFEEWVEVKNTNGFGSAGKIHVPLRTKRSLPEETVEMTVADVEKLVGKKVKIVK